VAFALDHVLLTAHGTLPAGETWSCGIRYRAQPDQAGLDTIAGIAAASWVTLVTNLGNNATGQAWSADTTLDGVTARVVNPAGITIRQAEGFPAGGSKVGGTPTKLPNQCSVVATLLTQRPGRTGKGRIYLPLLALTIGTTGRHTKTTVIATEVKGLIDRINSGVQGAGFEGTRCIVASKLGEGAESPITGVRVGDVVDTQRRRRDSVAEVYQTQAIA
jgi:hypothetical protein